MKSFQIWKFVLNDDVNRLEMPAGAMVLRAELQGDTLCLWAQVEPTMKTETREFHVFYTGAPFHQPDNVLYSYIGTVFYTGGIVVHVYEYLKISEVRLEEENDIPF